MFLLTWVLVWAVVAAVLIIDFTNFSFTQAEAIGSILLSLSLFNFVIVDWRWFVISTSCCKEWSALYLSIVCNNEESHDKENEWNYCNYCETNKPPIWLDTFRSWLNTLWCQRLLCNWLYWNTVTIWSSTVLWRIDNGYHCDSAATLILEYISSWLCEHVWKSANRCSTCYHRCQLVEWSRVKCFIGIENTL